MGNICNCYDRIFQSLQDKPDTSEQDDTKEKPEEEEEEKEAKPETEPAGEEPKEDAVRMKLSYSLTTKAGGMWRCILALS